MRTLLAALLAAVFSCVVSVSSAQPICWDTDSGVACLSITPYPTEVPTPTLTNTSIPTATSPPTATSVPTPTTIPTATRTLGPTLTSIPVPTQKPTSTPASGSSRIVGPGGQYATISAALAASITGDTIRIKAGTYSENPVINLNAVTLSAYGDGAVWIDGACTRAHGVTIHGNDVTVRGLGVKNVTDSGIWLDGDNGYKPYRSNVDANQVQDFNCQDTGEQYAAGVACLYCGSGQRVTNNTITRRVNIAGPAAGQGNGIWFKSSSAKPSGGGHYIAGNLIVGGWDGIGGEDEGDPRGSFDQNFVIENNAVSYCADDGVQVEGGGLNGWISKNRVNECGLSVAVANVFSGPLHIDSNIMASSTLGALGNLACVKVGNASTATVYLTSNVCNTTGDGLQQTNSGTATYVALNNTWNVGRYIYEWTYDAPLGTFDRDCMSTTDPTGRFVKWNNTTYGTLAALQAATGQELNATLGPCGSTPQGPTPTPTSTPGGTPMAWSFVQGKTNFGVASSSVATTFVSATGGLGSLVFVGIRVDDNTITINNPTDDSGASWAAGNLGQTGTAPRVKTYYRYLTVPINTITVTTSAATTLEVHIAEFSNQESSFLSASGSGTGTTETAVSVSSLTGTQLAGDLIVAIASTNNAVSFPATAGSGYTISTNGMASAMEYRLSAVASETAPMTVTTGHTAWAERAASFTSVFARHQPIFARQAAQRAATR